MLHPCIQSTTKTLPNDDDDEDEDEDEGEDEPKKRAEEASRRSEPKKRAKEASRRCCLLHNEAFLKATCQRLANAIGMRIIHVVT